MTRFLDVTISGAALVLLSPLLAILAVLLRLTGEGEVFYRQCRVGAGGRTFDVLKFATMLKDSANLGSGEITIRHDPRVLPIGRFLRWSKLNELPQLWNILIGDMSIVGPRPMVPNTFLHYPEDAKAVICSVQPGLTGVGSIVFRDEERHLEGLEDPVAFYRNVIIPYKAALELWYVENRSLGTYLTVVLVTAWVILLPRSSPLRILLPGMPPPPFGLSISRESDS